MWGGEGRVSEFLPRSHFKFCVLDLNEKAITHAKKYRINAVVGDGSNLPFKDNSFDVVISIDSLEHVPDGKKIAYCKELKRVTKRAVIIHCPADGMGNKFQGTFFDQQFFNWYLKRFKKEEPNIREHLESGLPKIEALLNIFPGAKIEGKQNGHVWLRYMKWGQTPYFGLLTGFWYKIFLSKKDKRPPYHACIMVWKKNLD